MQINRTAHHIKCCVINMGSGVERCCLRGSCCIHEFISCFYSRLGIRLQQPLHKVGWLGLCIHLLASIFILSPIFGIIFLLVYIRFIFPEVLSFLPCVKIPSVVFFPLCFGWNFRLMFLKEWPHISVQWLPVHLLHCLWKIAPFRCKTPLYSQIRFLLLITPNVDWCLSWYQTPFCGLHGTLVACSIPGTKEK